MTLVVGSNCFNGFVCVADIQATIDYNGSKPYVYFNCVQKIHKVSNNLCVAFCGDIKSGLKIIEGLQVNMKEQFKENEYFDIDGQSAILIDYLKRMYEKINIKNNPAVEFMFLWTAQEGDEAYYRPFCMKFKSPEFNMSSTPLIGVSMIGSGVKDKNYTSIVSFLSGREGQSAVYKNLFGDFQDAPKIWTVEKFKNLFLHEADKIDFTGVSKSFIFFQSTIDYAGIYPERSHEILTNLLNRLGLGPVNKKTKNHDLNLVEFDFEKLDLHLNKIKHSDPAEFQLIGSILRTLLDSADFESICRLPAIVSGSHIEQDEEIHMESLISTWSGMVSFLRAKNINIAACSATA